MKKNGRILRKFPLKMDRLIAPYPKIRTKLHFECSKLCTNHTKRCPKICKMLNFSQILSKNSMHIW